MASSPQLTYRKAASSNFLIYIFFSFYINDFSRTCVLEKRHVIGGAAVTEEIVPNFKFSRASYVLSLLRPQIMTDLELKKHGLKVIKVK